ncbi:glycoside hydrolase family 127 protein, partial [Pirellulales bacterium]|nr:glycoside hydrolase family 127 protein [Pirellulales bacterium]
MPQLSQLSPRILLLVVAHLLCCPTSLVFSAVVVDTSNSEFARIGPVGFDEVRWTSGFWRARTATCYEQSVPAMWELMESGKYKPFLGHFLIAAGRAEGGHHGAKWNDGDFYKWLEAATVAVAVTGDNDLQEAIDRSIAAIAAAQRDDGYLHTPVLIAQRNGDKDARPF